MKFEEDFDEVSCFTEDAYVVRGDIDLSEAMGRFMHYLDDEDIDVNNIKSAYIRFGFTPQEVDLDDSHCWFVCPDGRGAKKVWIFKDT